MKGLSGVLDLRYFGSVVRDDADISSDVDVLCVVSKKENADLVGIEKLLDASVVGGREIDLSVYGGDRISEMYREGHLFAWHLYQGSMAVSDGYCFVESLGKPAEYKEAIKDIRNLLEVLYDVRRALAEGGESLIFEAGLLYVVCRNIGIAASWGSDNGLDFSRNAPFTLVVKGVPKAVILERELYARLCACRHASMRGSPSPEICLRDVLEACDCIEIWALELLKGMR